MTRRAKFLVAFVVAILVASTGTAYAFWTLGATGNAKASADAVNAGNTPTGSATGTSITLNWSATTTGAAHAVQGYVITRYNAATGGTSTAAANGCAGTVAALTCTETGLANGTWYYTVTPKLQGWFGNESARSAGITVNLDNTPPVNNLSLNVVSGNAVLVGTNVYYKGSAAGSFTITNALTDSGSGPASSTFPALGGTTTNWSHSPSTVSTPAGGPYVSTTFSWSAGTTTSPTELITGTDVASNTAQTTLTFVNDNAPPVNNLSLSNQTGGGSFISGATVYYQRGVAGSFTITNALTDTGSGPASSSYPALGGTTTNWSHTASGTVSTPTGGPYVSTTFSWNASASTSPTEVVTGTDALGNLVTTTLTFTPDNTAPTTPVITFPTSNGLYNACSWTGSITGTATDATSGVAKTNVTVQRGSDSKFWNGTAWQSGSFTLVATGTTSWSQALSAINLTDDTYTVTAQTVDNVGNPSASASVSFTYDSTGPTISSVTMSGGTAGRIDAGDTIVVTFSEAMKVSNLCSTWSGDGSNQNLSGNGNVVITVADGTGATNDSLTVAAGNCTVNFGTINLGSNAYVSGGNATYSGNGSNASSMAWNATAKTLTITLGGKGGPGTVAVVATSTPVYTASSSITDSAGNGLTNSPFTLPAGQKF